MLASLFRFATGRVAAASFAVVVLSFAALFFINPKNEIKAELGRDYVATDSPSQTEGFLWYGYDTARVTGMLKRYGEDPGRFYGLHERFILRHDLLFPLLYGIPFVLMLAYLRRQVGGTPRRLVLLPLAAVALDYAENFTMLAFLRAFRANQQAPPTLLELSRAFTVAKWCAVLLSLALLVIFFLAFVVSRSRKSPAAP